MPIPTVICAVCQKSVSKRSTLSLEPLGAGQGRACRTHEEVVKALAEHERQVKLAKSMQAAESSLRIMTAVASVRVMYSFLGWPAEMTYWRLSHTLTKSELEHYLTGR